ncbi:hypothetical protein ACLK10_15910 [Escherichia coli]
MGFWKPVKADLTICDYNSPTPLLADSIAGHIAFGMGSGSVHSVMVNGVMVYEDRQFDFECEFHLCTSQKSRCQYVASDGCAGINDRCPLPAGKRVK